MNSPAIQRAPLEIYEQRRAALCSLLPGRSIVLASGSPRCRNLRAVRYPFRCSSHVLFFCGALPADSVLLITPQETAVFLPARSAEDEVWDGPAPDEHALKQRFGIDRAGSLEELGGELKRLGGAGPLALPNPDETSTRRFAELLGRMPDIQTADRPLADAVVELRLTHDSYGRHELRRAAEITSACFIRGMACTQPGALRRAVLAEMNAASLQLGGQPAFLGMATNRCEILHDDGAGPGALERGEMVLADFGAEAESGYCSDVTRTWPVSGSFSAAQREIYMLVLEAQRAAISEIKPGVRFRDVHMAAAGAAAEGLAALGILRGERGALVERGAHALFFPHGIGHLVGLDVHDMEDLGDLAGYPAGRSRAEQFGLNYLRLDRELKPGMAVSIEPGCYFIPALIDDPSRMAPFADCIDQERLAAYRGVRGIRIEDTVLVGDGGADVLTEHIPKELPDVESAVGAGGRRSATG